MAPEAKQVSTTLGTAKIATVQYFLSQILPPLHSEIDLDTVVAKLKRYGKKSHRPITKAGRWRGFPQDPEDAGRCSQTAFSHFPKIVDAICKCGAPKGVTPSLNALHNPRQGIYAEHRNHESLPDAYMVARGTDKNGVLWGDIGVVGEYDVGTWGRLSNAGRLCWSIERMFQDPRRRFVFGYTIENSEMRLWFCDRTQIIASKFFNFITDHKTVTHVFLSFLCAELHQLGWDTSIRMVKNLNKSDQYDFTVTNTDGSSSVFRSLELISGNHPGVLFGAGTRVWKVVQVVNGVPSGQPMVLKDTWIHEELEREGSTLQKIQQSDSSEDFQKAFSANFLTVFCHGDVLIHSSKGPSYYDRTRYHRRNLRAYRHGKPLPDPSLTMPRPRPPPPSVTKSILTGCRNHYRVVFKEICRPLEQSMPLPQVFQSLGQICEALKILHRLGWVHRDISKGNIMLDESGRARLTDLEYAKQMGDETVPEVSVGTTPFMSSEIASQAYRCTRPSRPTDESPGGNDIDSPIDPVRHSATSAGSARHSAESSSTDEIHRITREVQRHMQEHTKPLPPPKPRPPPRGSSLSPPPDVFDTGFRYNPLHDLESVFWVATYFLFTATSGHQKQEEVEIQERVRKKLLYEDFQHCCVIRLDGVFKYDVSSLHPSMQAVGLSLDGFRAQLTDRFYAAEKDATSITSFVADGLHERFSETLLEMSKLLGHHTDRTSHNTQTTLRKRGRGDDDERHTSYNSATSDY